MRFQQRHPFNTVSGENGEELVLMLAAGMEMETKRHRLDIIQACW
jgi:hypothetical protein